MTKCCLNCDNCEKPAKGRPVWVCRGRGFLGPYPDLSRSHCGGAYWVPRPYTVDPNPAPYQASDAIVVPDRLTSGVHANRAVFSARMAVRECCRAHGTACPDCRAEDSRLPRWLRRLQDLADVILAWRLAA